MVDQDDEISLPDLSSASPLGAEVALTEGEDDADRIRMAQDLDAVFDVPVNVSAVLGKTHIEVSNLIQLGRGPIVELARKVGDAIDIYVHYGSVAPGDVSMI